MQMQKMLVNFQFDDLVMISQFTKFGSMPNLFDTRITKDFKVSRD